MPVVATIAVVGHDLDVVSETEAELGRERDLLASQVAERTRSLQAAMDELRLASDAKTEFLANISHELRTPLTAIIGFVEILQTGMDGPLTPAQAADLGTVQESSRHLLELIDDLIDVASIESGRMKLVLGQVAVRELVRDAVESIRPLACERGVELELVGASSEVTIAADEPRLREIALNLLSNAVKFTPSRGRVRVSVEVEPGGGAGSDSDAAHRVVIRVRDSGVGVAAEDQERIFEKFVRIADPSIPGTGLGLAISRELARLHGGDLTLESTVGHGSTFTVRLPVGQDDR